MATPAAVPLVRSAAAAAPLARLGPLVLPLLLASGGCSGSDDGIWLPRLSQYGFFAGALTAQRPALVAPSGTLPGLAVVPYEVNAPLYSDTSSKLRFLAVPGGTRVGWDKSERWTFAEGATLIKTFYYPRDERDPAQGRRLLETRLLRKQGGEWNATTYLWNEAQDEAEHHAGGVTLPVRYLDAAGQEQSVDYQVPSSSQCKQCHLQDRQMSPIGPRTEELNRAFDYGAGPENQLSHLARLDLLDTSSAPGGTLPAPASLDAMPDPHGTAPLVDRARSWLAANCAHCHSARGYAASTGLRLGREITDPIDLGACRRPVAAGPASGGHLYDVDPGHPERSIMTFRINSLDAKVKMPQLPLTTIDAFGVDLVTRWIAQLEGPPCQ